MDVHSLSGLQKAVLWLGLPGTDVAIRGCWISGKHAVNFKKGDSGIEIG